MRSSLLLVPFVAVLGLVLAVACRQDDRVAPNPGTPIGPSAQTPAPALPGGAASTAGSAGENGASTANP